MFNCSIADHNNNNCVKFCLSLLSMWNVFVTKLFPMKNCTYLRTYILTLFARGGTKVFFIIIAKLSFNFNFNLVESWDGYILSWSTTTTPTGKVREHLYTEARTKTMELYQL